MNSFIHSSDAKSHAALAALLCLFFPSRFTTRRPWQSPAENIRDRAPTEQDWWNDSKDGEAGAGGNHNDKSSSKGVVASIIQPQSSASAFMIVDGKERKFHNCGLETWEQARKEWKKRTVDVIPPKPEPPKKHELAKGLAKASNVRTFELPRKMALPDLINTYQQVWNLPDGGR